MNENMKVRTYERKKGKKKKKKKLISHRPWMWIWIFFNERIKLNCKITTTIVALDAHESKKSYPNFTPSGYWTLHNYKTRALSLVGLSLSVDSLVTDFVSGGASCEMHTCISRGKILIAFTMSTHRSRKLR